MCIYIVCSCAYVNTRKEKLLGDEKNLIEIDVVVKKKNKKRRSRRIRKWRKHDRKVYS